MSEEIMNVPETVNTEEKTISSENETTTTGRKPNRVSVTIGARSYNTLATYCKYTEGATVSKVVNSLVQDFLDREDVKAVLEENKVDKKKQRMIAVKKAKLAKLQAEIDELEKE